MPSNALDLDDVDARIRDTIMARVEMVTESGCWVWMGATQTGGYGMLYVPGQKAGRAHRLSYRAFVGPIPAGYVICHRCDVPSCVNPDHLFAGTPKDNARDASSKGRLYQQTLKHCPHGHEYSAENTRRRVHGWRVCSECKRRASKSIRDRNRTRTRTLETALDVLGVLTTYDCFALYPASERQRVTSILDSAIDAERAG